MGRACFQSHMLRELDIRQDPWNVWMDAGRNKIHFPPSSAPLLMPQGVAVSTCSQFIPFYWLQSWTFKLNVFKKHYSFEQYYNSPYIHLAIFSEVLLLWPVLCWFQGYRLIFSKVTATLLLADTQEMQLGRHRSGAAPGPWPHFKR